MVCCNTIVSFFPLFYVVSIISDMSYRVINSYVRNCIQLASTKGKTWLWKRVFLTQLGTRFTKNLK